MQTKTKTFTIMLSIFLLVGLIALGVFWAIIRKSISTVYAKETEAQQVVAAQEQDLMLKSMLQDVEPDIADLNTRIIEATGTVPFIDNLQAAAKNTGTPLEVDSVQVESAPNVPDTFEYLTLALSTEGSWAHVYRILRMIETLPYKTVVHTVSLQQGTFTDQIRTSSTTASTTQAVSSWKATMSVSILKKK